MSSRIYTLPAAVANQIAAGEVIERPASVVKELLENALDSGATIISIDIGFGGLNHIKVSDNGSGIVADDLPLAIAAHATSKITQLNDLYALTSMGFRGEALASIASIARVSLSSKPSTQEHAMQLSMEGDVMRLLPCARTQGTTLEVRDLFFNAPVRKKFLKTPAQEYKAIELVVKRFALSAPMIALTLQHNGKQTLSLNAALNEQLLHLRIQKLLGKSFFEEAIAIDVERAGMRLRGWVSGISYQRSQNDKQWIYVNQRMVKDKLLNHALKQAYEPVLYPGRHPACVLYLTMPPNELDVNVHPTKHEVRFQQPRLVHDLLSSQISQAVIPAQAGIYFDSSFDCMPERDPRLRGDDSLRGHGDLREYALGGLMTDTNQSLQIRESSPRLAYSAASTPSARSWIVINSHFAILFRHNEPYLIDMELLYKHRVTSVLTQKTYPLDSRPLLVPVRLHIDNKAYFLFEKIQPELANVGVQFDFLSQTQILIRTIPMDLPLLDISQFFNCVSTITCTQTRLLNTLITSQLFDIQAISTEEKAMLADYLDATPEAVRLCCRHLDVDSCKGFLHV